MKVRIKKAPQIMAYGGQKKHSLDIVRTNIDDYDPDYNDIESRYHREADPRVDSNVEVEGGEIIAEKGPGGETRTFKAVGPNHSPDPNKEAGVPMNLKEGSFVYSKRKKELGVKGPVLKQFGKSENDKKTYSFAELADQYKVNKYYDILQSDKTDDLQKATAAAMVQKYEDKLADLAILQESRKGFPQGIPQIAEEKFQKMMAYMQQAEQQKQMEQQGQMQQQPPMMPQGMYGYNMGGGFVPDYSTVGDIYRYQDGGSTGDENDQIMQIIAAYSQLSQKPQEEIIQALQSLPEAQQQEALQQMYATVQQAMSQQQEGDSSQAMQQQDMSGYYSAPGGEPDYGMQQASEEEQQMRHGGLVRAYGGFNVTGVTSDPKFGDVVSNNRTNMAPLRGNNLTYEQMIAINPTLATNNPFRFKTLDAGIDLGWGKNLERQNSFNIGLNKAGADNPYSLTGNLNFGNFRKRGTLGLTGNYIPETGVYSAGLTYGIPSERTVTRIDEEDKETQIPRSNFEFGTNIGRNDEGVTTRGVEVGYTRNPKKATGVKVKGKVTASFGKGGSYSGTYDAASGSYFENGGSFIPTYGDSSYNDQFGGEIYDYDNYMLPRADRGFSVTSETTKKPRLVDKKEIADYEKKGYKKIPGTNTWEYKGKSQTVKGKYEPGKPGSTTGGKPGKGPEKDPYKGPKMSNAAWLRFLETPQGKKYKEKYITGTPGEPGTKIAGTEGRCLDANGNPDPNYKYDEKTGECTKIVNEENDLITIEEGPTTTITTIPPGPPGGGDFGGGYYGMPFQNTLGLMAAAAYPPLYIRPFYDEPQGVIPRPTFYDPERELQSAQESARALEQMASMVNPQSAGAMANYIQSNAAKTSADTIGRYQNLNVGVANQFSPLQAQIFNSIAAQKREAKDKRYMGEAIAAQQYNNAMRAYATNVAKTLGEGITAGQKLGQLYDTNAYYAADPFGRLRLKPGVNAADAIMSGTMAGRSSNVTPDQYLQQYNMLKQKYPTASDKAIENALRQQQSSSRSSRSNTDDDDVASNYGYGASAYPFMS
jgi:hypothetical protein